MARAIQCRVRSSPSGFTWDYRATIILSLQIPTSDEGASEHSLVTLANGHILMVTRTDGGGERARPVWQPTLNPAPFRNWHLPEAAPPAVTDPACHGSTRGPVAMEAQQADLGVLNCDPPPHTHTTFALFGLTRRRRNPQELELREDNLERRRQVVE